jgi:hypothetical protein
LSEFHALFIIGFIAVLAPLLARLPALIRTPVVVLYKRVLPERDLLPLALFSSTTLPLVVAMTYLGVRTGDMAPENASALVGAAVISVTVFPTLAILLRSKSEEARPDDVVAIAIHRVADLASALFSRFSSSFLRKLRESRDRDSRSGGSPPWRRP